MKYLLDLQVFVMLVAIIVKTPHKCYMKMKNDLCSHCLFTNTVVSKSKAEQVKTCQRGSMSKFAKF